MYNNFFTIASLFYSLLLTIVFFSKKRLQVLENKVYGRLVITNLLMVVVAILCFFGLMNYDSAPVLSNFLSKSLLIIFWIWGAVFAYYTMIISFKDKKKDTEKSFKYLIILFSVLFIVTLFLIIILPLNYFAQGNIAYTYGPAANAVYLCSGFNYLLIICSVIYNRKHIMSKKYIPLLIFILLGGVVIVIQKMYPGLLLLTSFMTFVTFVMYFTIENPDLKLITQLNLAKDLAEKSSKAKTDFLSNMSHEIRTPLNAIVGFSHLLLDDDINEEARSEIKDIIYASDTLLEIVNGILDISKIEEGKLEIINTEYDFKALCDNVSALIKSRMREDRAVAFETNIDPSIPDVLHGDSSRIKQIMINLLTNAVKYTKKGTINFTVSSVLTDKVCRLIISVEDTGIGIKKENIDKLFTKFERLGVEKNTTTEGTGLGLAITKKLVELMNGKIVVQSVFGKGSKFTVAIDQRIVKVKTKEKKEVKTIKKEYENYSHKRVMVVDDNIINIKVAQRLLKNYKIDAFTCTSGSELIEKIIMGEKYDLILLDDMMPKKSGCTTFSELKELKGFDIPVIMLTANAITGMKEKYMDLGFSGYLAKPVDLNELDMVLDKYLK